MSRQVRTSIDQQLASLNTALLGEYFSRGDVSKNLFMAAKEFECLAYNRNFQSHSMATPELRGMLYCFLDYWEIDRVIFSDLPKSI